MQQRCGWIGLRAPCAGRGHVGNNRVGAHGEPANGFRIHAFFFEQIEHRVAGETAALRVQRGGAAVDVVVARASGGKLELAKPKASAGQKSEQLFAVIWIGHRNRFYRIGERLPAGGPMRIARRGPALITDKY